MEAKSVLDEPVDLLRGQGLIVTVLEHAAVPTGRVDLSPYVGRGPKMFGEGQADAYVRELRADDRYCRS